jgi:TnpA family transposase
MCSGGGDNGYAHLQYIRRRDITKQQLRAAIARVCNAILRLRNPRLWGEGTMACAWDSTFGARDQNLINEWQVRYGGRGHDLRARREELRVHLLAAEIALFLGGFLHDRRCARQDTEMDVERQYVDTHGQSEVGFAFSDLLICWVLSFSRL